jgi:hypothetical protein
MNYMLFYCRPTQRKNIEMVSVLQKWMLKAACKPKAILPGFETSIDAAYTPQEIAVVLANAGVHDVKESKSPLCLTIIGGKRVAGQVYGPPAAKAIEALPTASYGESFQ